MLIEVEMNEPGGHWKESYATYIQVTQHLQLVLRSFPWSSLSSKTLPLPSLLLPPGSPPAAKWHCCRCNTEFSHLFKKTSEPEPSFASLLTLWKANWSIQILGCKICKCKVRTGNQIQASTSDISQQSTLPALSEEMEQNVPLSVLGSGGMTRRSAIAARPGQEVGLWTLSVSLSAIEGNSCLRLPSKIWIHCLFAAGLWDVNPALAKAASC